MESVPLQRRHDRVCVGAGWLFEPGDADLPSGLGDTAHYVERPSDYELAHGQRPVAKGDRAQAIIRGQANGMAFVAFDLSSPSQRPLRVTTAWLVRLPHALPLFASVEMFRDEIKARNIPPSDPAAVTAEQAGQNTSAAPDPDFAKAVMTPDVVQFTRDQFPSWWVDGTVLASTAHVKRGAPPDQLTRNIEAITWLGTVLSSPAIAARDRRRRPAGVALRLTDVVLLDSVQPGVQRVHHHGTRCSIVTLCWSFNRWAINER